jgi:hypothetical protein
MNNSGHGIPGLLLLGYSFTGLFQGITAAGVLTYTQIFAGLAAGIYYLYSIYKKSKRPE